MTSMVPPPVRPTNLDRERHRPGTVPLVIADLSGLAAQGVRFGNGSQAHSRTTYVLPFPLPLEFVRDRSLGKRAVPDALRAAGWSIRALVEVYGEREESVADTEWLERCGRENWVALTKDRRIRYRPTEIAAIRSHNVKAFVLPRGNLTAADKGTAFHRERRQTLRGLCDRWPVRRGRAPVGTALSVREAAVLRIDGNFLWTNLPCSRPGSLSLIRSIRPSWRNINTVATATAALHGLRDNVTIHGARVGLLRRVAWEAYSFVSEMSLVPSDRAKGKSPQFLGRPTAARKEDPQGHAMTRNDDHRPTRSGWRVLKAECLRAVFAVGLLGGVMATGASAATGDLLQKPGASGCFSNIGFCLPATALSAAQGVTISPDGQNVYIPARESDAVAVFDRDADGTLVQKPGPAGCISDTGVGRCVDGSALDGASSVTVSPDGENAYVTAALSDSIAVFDRTPNGRLVQKSGRAGCISDTGSSPCADGRRLDGPTSVTVSPDGESVYVAAEFSDAIVIFDRAPNGKLTQKAGEAGCISDSGDGSCADGRGLLRPTSVALSPDGESAYVTADRTVGVFDRATDGTLKQKSGAAGCTNEFGNFSCVNGTALDGTNSVTVSPDGESVYVASSSGNGGVAVFDRGREGRLTQKPGASGCINSDGSSACTDGSAIAGAISVAVSPDGQSVYVASYKGAVAIFNRAPNGTLAQKPNPKGCVRETASSACADGSALFGANSVAVSPDGLSVYVASDSSDALALFDRDPAP